VFHNKQKPTLLIVLNFSYKKSETTEVETAKELSTRKNTSLLHRNNNKN